jgi:hypothetical protein
MLPDLTMGVLPDIRRPAAVFHAADTAWHLLIPSMEN